MVIGRVENLGDGFDLALAFQSLGIFATGEEVHIDFIFGTGGPKAEYVHRFSTVAADKHIVGNSKNFVITIVIDDSPGAGKMFTDFAAETDADSFIFSGGKPNTSVFQPDIGHFKLPAVYDLLFKDTILITDGEAGCREVATCKSIQVTGSQTAKSAVAKTGIGFFVVNLVGGEAEFGAKFRNIAFKVHVVEVVAEHSAHQKLQRKVVYSLFLGRFIFFAEGGSLLRQHQHDNGGDSFVQLGSACLISRMAIGNFQHFADVPFEACVIHRGSSGHRFKSSFREIEKDSRLRISPQPGIFLDCLMK